MSGRRQKRLAVMRKNITFLERRIAADSKELAELKQRATFLQAELAVEAMAEWQRSALVSSAMSTNLKPRPIVMNDGSYDY